MHSRTRHLVNQRGVWKATVLSPLDREQGLELRPGLHGRDDRQTSIQSRLFELIVGAWSEGLHQLPQHHVDELVGHRAAKRIT
jgi:hypothetical protein